MLHRKFRLLLINKAAAERKKELDARIAQKMQKAAVLKREVAACRQLLARVKAARGGETPMDVDPDSTTHPHSITEATSSHPHHITTTTPSHPHHITTTTPSHPHHITTGTPSNPHGITTGASSQPLRITAGTPSRPRHITTGTPSQPHRITTGTPSQPHRITTSTPSQPSGHYAPGVMLPPSHRPMPTGLQSRQRMARTPLERRGVCVCVCVAILQIVKEVATYNNAKFHRLC